MKKLLPVAVVLTLLPVAAYADSPSGYISFGTGLSLTKNSYWHNDLAAGAIDMKAVENFSGAVGVSYCNNLRTELEVSYRRPDIKSLSFNGTDETASGKFTTWTGLVNGYYDFFEGQNFRPYVSAGVGAASHKLNISSVDLTQTSANTVFAYQAGLGASYSVVKAVTLWGGYRYLSSAKSSFSGLNASYGANEFNAGLRLNF